MSNPAARAFSRHASTLASSATAAEIASVNSRANWFKRESIKTSTNQPNDRAGRPVKAT
jgi:hypothetical protein